MQEPNRFKALLVQIWPVCYRIINGFFYFLLTLIRGIFRLAFKQLGNQ